ncbi:MAG: aminopeptidase P family N-terminal domain-containing protein, partial [Succinivibrio sp.]|nr:aminopeptidase P family N-terminal domain-containing protein [Succinivibrio sp.]
MSDLNKTIFSQRVSVLKDAMAQAELDALIISHDDEFLSYELNEDKERIKYNSGFSGSAGYVVIARNFNPQLETRGIELSNNRGDETTVADRSCAVFVDGRYVVQVKDQIDSKL